MSNAAPSGFELFMASGYGRAARALLGIALIAAGLMAVGGTAGWVVAALGLAPIASATLGLCPVAPLWGGHFLGVKYCSPRKR
jgi:hypothetical protein